MTTMQTQEPLARIVVQANSLKPDELDALQECIDGVRSGEKEYYVLLTNKKQTNSKKRMPGIHYDAHPALAPHAHKGWLVAAPLNKQEQIYLHIFDEARAQELGENFGHTRVTLKGLRSFEVLRSRPGPLAAPIAQGVACPFAVFAQAWGLMAQAMALMSQAMVQAQQPK